MLSNKIICKKVGCFRRTLKIELKRKLENALIQKMELIDGIIGFNTIKPIIGRTETNPPLFLLTIKRLGLLKTKRKRPNCNIM